MSTLSNTSSGAVTAANQSQQVSAANPARDYWLFHNPNASCDLWLGLGQAATRGKGSLRVPPGKSIDSSVIDTITQGAIFVLCSTAGAEWTFIEEVTS